MNDDNCIICNKHKDNLHIVYQNQFIAVSHYVKYPKDSNNYLGYYMVESKRHFRGIYDATDEEMIEIGKIVKLLSKALMNVLDAGHVYVFVIGEGVDHFHAHVIARYKNAPKEYWGPKVDEWPDAPRGTVNDIWKLDEKIFKELKNK